MKAMKCILLLALIAASIILPEVIYAQAQENILDGVVNMYREAASGWRSVILRYATRLFWLLVGIDFIWTGIHLALEQADFSKIVAELIKRVMIIGFYFALILNSGIWPEAIIQSFRQMAVEANAQGAGIQGGISPSDIFDMGLRIAGVLSDQVSLSDPGESFARVITGIIVILAFAIVSGLLLVALIELYIALNAALIFLAFGGSRWTSEYANKYMVYIVSVGIKIFAMQLLIGIGQSFVSKFFNAYEGENMQSLVFVGVSVVLLLLVKTIPDTLQGVINGHSLGGAGNALIAGASAAAGGALGAATGGLAAGAGGSMAVMEAAKLAGLQKGGSNSTMKNLGSLAMETAKNLGRSAASDMGGRLSGSPGHQYGQMGGRMAARLKEERLSIPPRKPEDGELKPKESEPSGVPTLTNFD